MAVKCIGYKATDDIHLPMGKIEDVHKSEDQGETKRDHRVLGPQIDAVSQYLFHAVFFRGKTLGQIGPGKFCLGQIQKQRGNISLLQPQTASQIRRLDRH